LVLSFRENKKSRDDSGLCRLTARATLTAPVSNAHH
jgi:hypothetical protein